MIGRIYNPEVFQGNLKKKNYFEGWYFKHVSKDSDNVYSFIPGISLTEQNRHAFIQVINGITGKSDYITYPIEEFTWEKKNICIKVGNSVFTEKSVDLNITDKNLTVTGHLEYTNIIKYPKSLFSPGIMGWYSFIPYMECKHGIVSVNHKIKGRVSVNNHIIDFDEGQGYIEKDWGSSFPEAWIWIQANNFKMQSTSFNFSIAKIPWLGKFFIGFIAFLYFDKKFFLFSTYNNSKFTQINHNSKSFEIVLKNKNSVLKVSAIKSTFGELIAPVSGDMSRRIKESNDSKVELELFDKDGNLLYADTSTRAGLEIIEKIFDYIL